LITDRHRQHLIAAAALALLCFICYANTIHVPFLFDDIPNIVDNRAVHVEDLKPATLRAAAAGSVMPSRPLANISFAINYYFDRLQVAPYHLVNIFIHFINGLLVYLLALFVFRRSAPGDMAPQSSIPVYMAMFAAAIFVVHPLQIQSVTYIVQRMNSLCTLFYLSAMLCYLQARTTHRFGRRVILFAATAVSWVLALGCKEIAATLPAAILLLEWYFLQDADWGFFRKRLVPVSVLVILMAGIAWYFLGADPLARIMNDYQSREFSLGERLFTESRVIVFYLSLLLLPLPSRLNLLHQFSLSHSLLSPPTTLLCLLLLLGLIIFAVLSVRRQRLLSFCIIWFFLQLTIESSFIGLEIIFEHRLYLPMVGVSIAAAYILFRLVQGKQGIIAICAVLVVIALSAGTVVRNMTWSSAERLWTDVIRKNPDSYRAYYNLANEYTDRGMYQQAVAAYQQSISIKPDYARSHNNLGIALTKQGKLDQAIAEYELARQLDPDNYRSSYNMALAQSASGNAERAITEYRVALAKNPDYAQAQYNLGNLFDQTGNREQAEYYYREALHSNPNHAMANNNLAILLARAGKYQEALAIVKKVIELQPEFYGGYINLGNLYVSMHKLEQACPEYKKALQLAPDTDQIPEKIKKACNF